MAEVVKQKAVIHDETHPINYNRGVMIRDHGSLGVKVYMYLDDPGLYLNVHGKPIAETLAKQAGFDVVEYRKRRSMKLATTEFERKLRAQYEAETQETLVVETKGLMRIVDLGHGRFYVQSSMDGTEWENLHKEPLGLEMAKTLLAGLGEPSTPSE